MKYFVKYISNGTYSLGDKFTINAGQELETIKEIYDYLNSTYGSSGWFTFRTDGDNKPAQKKEEAESSPAPKKAVTKAPAAKTKSKSKTKA